MERQKRAVVCGENVAVADCMWDKRQEIAESPKGISDNLDATLYKAYCNLCNCKTPIKTLKELSEIKGIGKWMLKLMQGFFASSSATSDNEDPSQKGKSNKGKKRYVPQKNSVAYALLVTLYRAIANGKEFMRRQELIDSAEASGLSRVSIAAEKGKGKAGNLGNSPQGWYSGWSCMKTLITRGLVVKSSNPAKYMLTEEGKEAARECISRSGLVDSDENISPSEVLPNLEQSNTNIKRKDTPDLGQTCAILSPKDVASPSDNSKRQKKSIDIPQESLDKFLKMGFSQEIVISAYAEVSKRSRKKDVAALWPAVLCHLREGQIYGQVDSKASEKVVTNPSMSGQFGDFNSSLLTNSSNLQPCSSNDYTVNKQIKSYVMPLPPLEFGERFQEVYEIILILDDREHFATQGSRSRKLIESVCSQFKIQIEVRRLPIGDCIWIARNKTLKSEYVLDFIVERKKIDDLRISIRDNRYKDQKLRLLRCGLKKMIYLVEGDPNFSEAAESIKTACFTTEISEGFDVQRTSGLGDTLRKYGHLTQAIKQYYYTYLDPENKSGGTCVSFTGFLKRCQDLDKLTVSDVFAIQLMQVPHVTEDIAIAVLDMYPTLISLASAYSLLDGDVRAQEEMLKKQSNNLISGIASRNIFQLVWAD